MADPPRKYLHRTESLWKSPLRVQAQATAPARYLLSMDWDYRREKDHKDHQQGSGPGVPATHPQLPPASEGYRDPLTDGSRRRTVDIPFQVVAKQVKAAMSSTPNLWVIESLSGRLQLKNLGWGSEFIVVVLDSNEDQGKRALQRIRR